MKYKNKTTLKITILFICITTLFISGFQISTSANGVIFGGCPPFLGNLPAHNVTVDDVGGYYNSDNAEDVFQEIGLDLSNIDINITDLWQNITDIDTNITDIWQNISDLWNASGGGGDISRFFEGSKVYVNANYTSDNVTRKEFQTVRNALDYVRNQTPSATNPWVVYIYPGYYVESAGTWIEDVNESALIIPDYTCVKGMCRDSVIITYDWTVILGEKMNLFGAIQEGDKSTTASSHIAVCDLTIINIEGDAIQSDSFIKKPDYPEFRLQVKNVKIINASTGVKVEERNSWSDVRNIYIENCDIGLHVDDAKMFASDVIIRQNNATQQTKLTCGLYAEDKKGKIQAHGVDIGVNFYGLDRAYLYGVHVEDKAEIHIYDGRIDNVDYGIYVAEAGEIKTFSIKIHDCYFNGVYTDIDLDNSVLLQGTQIDAPIEINGGNVKIYACLVDTDDFVGHSIEWNSEGNMEIAASYVRSIGQSGGTDYHCIHFTATANKNILVANSFQFSEANPAPDYLVYSTVNNMLVGSGNYMYPGMNGNCIVDDSTKIVGGRTDCYVTIQDAIDASSTGDIVLISPSTYTEQINPKAGIVIKGTSRSNCVIQYADKPIADVDTTAWYIETLTIQTTVVGNTICELEKGFMQFTDCNICNGIIRFVGANITGNTQLWIRDCTLITNNENVYNIEATGTTSHLAGIQIYDSRIDELSGGINWDMSRTSSRHIIRLENVQLCWGNIICNHNTAFTLLGGSYYSEKAVPLFQFATSHGIKISNADIESWGGFSTINITATPSTFSLLGCVFAGSTGYDIQSNVSVTATVISNVMYNGMNGNIETISPTKYVQGGVDFHKTIQDAIDASSAGDVVQVNPGTYTEQISPKAGIKIIGLDVDACILQNTGASATTYPLADIGNPAGNAPFYNIESMTIRTTIASNTIFRIGNTKAGWWASADFKNCKFNQGRFVEITSSCHSGYNFDTCHFTGDTYGFNLVGTFNKNVYLTFINCYFWCSPDFMSSHSAGSAGANLYDGCIFEPAGAPDFGGDWELRGKRSMINAEQQIQYGSLNRTVEIEDCTISGGINFTAINNGSIFKNNKFEGMGPVTPDITGTVTLTNVLYLGNAQDNGIDNTIQTTSATKNVGGGIDCYITIQHAVDASSDGDLVNIAPGTYNEQITLKSGITIEGTDRDTTVLTRTSNPIVCTGLGGGRPGCSIKKLKITADKGNILCDLNGRATFEDCLFTNAGGTGNTTRITADTQTDHIIFSFIDCDMEVDIVINQVSPVIWKVNSVRLTDCTFCGKIDCVFNYNGGVTIKDSTLDVGFIEITGDNSNPRLQIQGTGIYGEEDVCIELDGINGGGFGYFSMRDSNIGTDDDPAIIFDVAPNTCILAGNSIIGGGSNPSIQVEAGVTVDADEFLNNLMNNGIGGNGTFTHSNVIKKIGGCTDFYQTIQGAIDACRAGDIVTIFEDQTITSALTPPSYQIEIDGLNQFSITRGVASTIMTLNASDNVKFTHIDLLGVLDVAGNNATLMLTEHTHLDGMIDVQSGDSSTLIHLDQCTVDGDSSDNYCIKISDVDPTIEIKNSYLKGNSGNPAIYYNSITNNNVKIKYCSIMYGSLGANNPFGRSGAQTPTISSHHNIYNEDPYEGAGTWITNNIGADTLVSACDIEDPDGDW